MKNNHILGIIFIIIVLIGLSFLVEKAKEEMSDEVSSEDQVLEPIDPETIDEEGGDILVFEPNSESIWTGDTRELVSYEVVSDMAKGSQPRLSLAMRCLYQFSGTTTTFFGVIAEINKHIDDVPPLFEVLPHEDVPSGSTCELLVRFATTVDGERVRYDGLSEPFLYSDDPFLKIPNKLPQIIEDLNS